MPSNDQFECSDPILATILHLTPNAPGSEPFISITTSATSSIPFVTESSNSGSAAEKKTPTGNEDERPCPLNDEAQSRSPVTQSTQSSTSCLSVSSPSRTIRSVVNERGSDHFQDPSANAQERSDHLTPRFSYSDSPVLDIPLACLRSISPPLSAPGLATPVFMQSSDPPHPADVPLNVTIASSTDQNTNDTITLLTALSKSSDSVRLSDSDEKEVAGEHPEGLQEALSCPIPSRTQGIPVAAPSTLYIQPPSRGLSQEAGAPELVPPTPIPVDSNQAVSNSVVPPAVSGYVSSVQILKKDLLKMKRAVEPTKKSLLPPKRPNLGDQQRDGQVQTGVDCFYVFNANVDKRDSSKLECLLQLLTELGFDGTTKDDIEIFTGVPTMRLNCDRMNFAFRAILPVCKNRIGAFVDHKDYEELTRKMNFFRFGDDYSKYQYITRLSSHLDSVIAQILVLFQKEMVVPDGTTLRFTPSKILIQREMGNTEEVTIESICRDEKYLGILKSVSKKLSNNGKKKMEQLMMNHGVSYQLLK